MPEGHEKESLAKIQRYMSMMDSLTNEGNSRPFYVVFALQYFSPCALPDLQLGLCGIKMNREVPEVC